MSNGDGVDSLCVRRDCLEARTSDAKSSNSCSADADVIEAEVGVREKHSIVEGQDRQLQRCMGGESGSVFHRQAFSGNLSQISDAVGPVRVTKLVQLLDVDEEYEC